jgi:hypothetical protein
MFYCTFANLNALQNAAIEAIVGNNFYLGNRLSFLPVPVNFALNCGVFHSSPHQWHRAFDLLAAADSHLWSRAACKNWLAILPNMPRLMVILPDRSWHRLTDDISNITPAHFGVLLALNNQNTHLTRFPCVIRVARLLSFCCLTMKSRRQAVAIKPATDNLDLGSSAQKISPNSSSQ